MMANWPLTKTVLRQVLANIKACLDSTDEKQRRAYLENAKWSLEAVLKHLD